MALAWQYRERKPKDVQTGDWLLVDGLTKNLLTIQQAVEVIDKRAVNPARYIFDVRPKGGKVEKMFAPSRETLRVLTDD